MLERIEPDGTLYSYASCTFLMIFALLALGYDKQHPVITRAVRGLTAMVCSSDGKMFLQNSPSAVWDTALLSHALQEAGVAPESKAIRSAASYIVSKQQRTLGDWSLHNRNPVPGGWGFSDSNTINPDVDDTTAALRAIKRLAQSDPPSRDAWNRGLNWLLSMQNRDGGWPAFERDTDNKLLAWLPIDGAQAAAIDPSSADLTGRTLEFFGEYGGARPKAPFRSPRNGLADRSSGRGRLVVRTLGDLLYIWHMGRDDGNDLGGGRHGPSRCAKRRQLAKQHPESRRRLGRILQKRSAYAVCAARGQYAVANRMGAGRLIAFHPKPVPEVEKGMQRLLALLSEDGWAAAYPTGAGLPGAFYMHYHSYRYIWPLLALSHYRKKNTAVRRPAIGI